jgi:hypothetical protein
LLTGDTQSEKSSSRRWTALARADLKAIAAGEVDIQEGQRYTSEAIKVEYEREDASGR